MLLATLEELQGSVLVMSCFYPFHDFDTSRYPEACPQQQQRNNSIIETETNETIKLSLSSESNERIIPILAIENSAQTFPNVL